MAAAIMYVTPAGAGAKDGSDWDNAMGLSEWKTDAEGSAEAGDIYYVKEGTYTLTGNWNSALDGSTQNPIKIIGVNAETTNEPPVLSDWADGDDRPLIAAAANSFIFDDQWEFYNLRVTITTDSGFRADSGCKWYNCYVYNSSGTSGRFAVYAYGASACLVFGCEAISTNGPALMTYSIGLLVIGCYFHDSAIGMTLYNDAFIVDNIIDTCSSYGANMAERYGSSLVNNTFYNNGIAIRGTTAALNVFLNNIIEHEIGQTGASWTTEYANFWDYNNWHGEGTDVSNVTKGPNATASDPQFTDASNGVFSIGTNLKAAAFPGAFPGGLCTGYLDTGAVQREETGGAGGGGVRNPLGGPI